MNRQRDAVKEGDDEIVLEVERMTTVRGRFQWTPKSGGAAGRAAAWLTLVTDYRVQGDEARVAVAAALRALARRIEGTK